MLYMNCRDEEIKARNAVQHTFRDAIKVSLSTTDLSIESRSIGQEVLTLTSKPVRVVAANEEVAHTLMRMQEMARDDRACPSCGRLYGEQT